MPQRVANRDADALLPAALRSRHWSLDLPAHVIDCHNQGVIIILNSVGLIPGDCNVFTDCPRIGSVPTELFDIER